MKILIALLILLTALVQSGVACSMYKITNNGKTIVGNNEDWISPNSKFWFVPGGEGKYGVMNMGQLDNFVQGAINEAGLVFDGFGNPSLEVKNTEGKLNIPIGQAVEHIMQTMDNVMDVKKYFATINLSSFTNSMLVFVDRTGAYLIVEGDELIIGQEPEKTFSNFYYSQIESIDKVDLPNVQNGLKYLNESTGQPSLDYCGTVMDHLSNVDNLTQYSTIYDLDKLTIKVYLYNDFSNAIEINLMEELEKGTHETMIPELFPKESPGYIYYEKYNDEEEPTQYLREWIKPFKESEEKLVKHGFAFNLNWIGYEWLNGKNNVKAAIEVFYLATELMPNQANLYDSLGEAYLKNGNYEKANKSYMKSLALNPENENAKEVLSKIKKELSDKRR